MRAAPFVARILARLRRRSLDRLQRAEAARAAAERTSEAKTLFLANVSHELRTPLNGVLGATRLLAATPLTAEQQEYVAMARASADLLLGLIDDVLDFSKIEAHKLTLESLPFPLRATLTESIRVLMPRADAKGLALACDVHAGVPDALVGDPGRLRQVVMNLVGNAIKFTEDGEVAVAVRAHTGDDDTVALHVSVRDTGVGIAPARQGVIFDAFTQADGSTTRTHGGTGLGLSIASRLVAAMGGRIWVESEVGRGSAFHFTAALRRQTGEAAAAAPMAGVSVLVAEPNANYRRILAEMLYAWRIDVSQAESGTEALAILEQARAAGRAFTAVLIAVDIQGLGAFTLAERIDATPGLAEAVIMMMRSVARHRDRERCEEAGVAAILTRPISQSELWDALVSALGARSLVESREAAPASAPRPLRILLVEDNPINQAVAERTLDSWGHAVTVADNGRGAMEAIDRERFDAVIMDVHMPVMDGFEVTAAIRRREAGSGEHLPIIAMTARAMDGDRERCLAAGMDVYLAKPVIAARLFEALEHVTGSSGVFDPVALRARLDGNVELERRLVGLFFESVPAVIARIRAAVAGHDAPALVDAAHMLKGAVTNFDAPAPERAAARLEAIGRGGDFAMAPEALADLEEGIARLSAELEKILCREG